MTAENLQNLLAQPYRIAESELEALEELVTQFPYFQLGHLLIAKYAHDQESMLAPQKTRRAAVYAQERRLLRRLMNALPPKEQQEGKTAGENLGQELKNSKSFFDLLPSIDLDDSPEGYTPQAERPVKELLKEPIETIWEDQLSEGAAIELFNAGKIEEAGRLYEALAQQNPEQAADIRQRWRALSSNLPTHTEEEAKEEETEIPTETPQATEEKAEMPQANIEETKVTPETAMPADNVDAFFEDIVPDGQPDYLHFNEGIALGLYYDGKEKESIEMYKKLMELYPEKREYYQDEAIMLVGKKAFMASFEASKAGEESLAETEAEPKQGIVLTKEEILPTETEPVQEILPAEAEPKQGIVLTKEEILPTETEPVQETLSQDEIALQEVEPAQEILPAAVETLKEETKHDEETHDFFADIEHHQTDKSQTPHLTPEEQPFFDSIEEAKLGEGDKVNLPPLELPQTEPTVPDDEAIFLTESQAIAFFNQGKIEGAITLYEQLVKQNPVKASYYEGQIRVLRETLQEALRPKKKSIRETKSIDNEELSEDLAIRLFTQDRTAEAIAVYERLIEKFPSKRGHYLRQIEVLKS